MSLRTMLCFTLAVLLASLPVADAQQPAAPVPPQITNAHTVFLSNAGGDPLFTYFDGGTDRAYNDLYAALKASTHFQLASTPAAADLILEVRSIANQTVVGAPPETTAGANPEIRLQILDPSSHAVLWSLNSYIRFGIGGKKTRDREFDQAATALFDQFRQLTGETLTAAEAKSSHTKPGVSRKTTLIYVAIIIAAVVVPLAIVLSHRNDKPKIPTLPACAPFCPA